MARLTQELTVGGRKIGGASTSGAATETSTAEEVPAGKAGTLTTRTDDSTGTLTMASGHGLTTGQKIDLYWSGGVRRAVTVGTVAGDTVPIGGVSDGKGDVLPAAGTAIVASVRKLVDIDVDGNTVVMAGADVSAARRASVDFEEQAGATIHAVDLAATASEKAVWIMGTNVFAAKTLGKVAISNGSSDGAATVQLGLARDNVS